MKSGYYIAIFVVIAVVVGGALLYNASTVYDVPNGEVTTIKKTSVTKQDDKVIVEKEINVLTDEDFEMDEFDYIDSMDMSEFDDLDDLVVDEVVAF